MADFLGFVEHQAKIQNKMFFPNKFEGRNYFDDSTGWELEDVSGWLFDNNDIDLIKRFIIVQGSPNEDSFSNYYYTAVWKFGNGEQLCIDFISSKH